MSVYVKIEKNRYIDSLETLFATTVLNEQPGIAMGYIGMCNNTFRDVITDIGLMTEEIAACTESDYVVVADAESSEAFEDAVAEVNRNLETKSTGNETAEYDTAEAALEDHPEVNLVHIAVPGDCALEEAKKALNAGKHICVFSNNVPFSDEREMKELAREKGLLCMGPDCGVANINGAALVLSSITNRGPFGIVGASGTGIQHVAAIIHEAGSGVTQTIGVGGNDLKDPIGGISMLMGLEALEKDPETKYIVVISRKPGEKTLPVICEKLKSLTKPRIVLFMGCEREIVEATGSVWAENLDDCGVKALKLIGVDYDLGSEEELDAIAAKAIEGMAPEQKYLRGGYSGGTYMDEAMHAMYDEIGDVWSNCPLNPDYRLEDSYKSVENTVIDYGEEEFTLGRPHPAIDPSIRKPAVLREASDPEVAVICLDFILTPPGHPDPAGYLVEDIKKAQQMARDRGGKLVFIASVLGTTADFQDIRVQEQELRDAGVIVLNSNARAAKLAGKIIRLKEERDHGRCK